MIPKIDLEKLVEQRGYPPEVAAAVLADVEKHGTRSLIETGRSVLPGLKDAIHWHKRQLIEAGLVPLHQAPPGTVQALQDRIAALEAKGGV